MQLLYYYIHLFVQCSNSNANKPIKLTRNEISNILQCTERNVIHILNRMEEKEWITRVRGKGRGNPTVITFTKSITDMLTYMEASSRDTDFNGLITYLERHDILRNHQHVLDTILKELFGMRKDITQQEGEECLHIPYFRSFHSLDPSQVERQTEIHMVQQLFDTLVTFNKDTDKVEPSIAYYWERDESGKVWTFYLRKGIPFHNGKMLDAEDVKFTFERLKDTPAKWIVAYLEKMNSIGSHAIQFHFAIPIVNWPFMLCSPKASIVPMGFAEQTVEEFSREPIGTGPYKVKSHNTNLLSLSVHQSYFKERAHIDEIFIHVMPSVEKFMNIKEIEEEPLFYIPFTWNTNTDRGYKNVERGHLSIKYLMWNMRKDKIRSNHLLREKLGVLLNKKRMIEALGYPRYEPVRVFHQNRPNNDKLYNMSLDIDYMDTLILMTYNLKPNEEDIKWIKSECNKQGIHLELRVVPYSNFYEEAKEADIVLSEYVAEDVEEVALLNLFHSEMSILHNLLDRENSRITQGIYKELVQEVSSNRRIQIMNQLENKLIENHIVMPLYSTYQKALYHENLMGISLSIIGLVPFKDLFFRKEYGSN
ncbi:SgrR family transcriptional regulator [Ornithinibacillus sp. BX22]|uniref:SgrR family transcriptional regulator n=1 Tax=Ornithinibacillus hominis TaxID=2763055 RepID=A0A923RHU3_9BACI|nr:ABC transporter substrate-binding protein [Ornithinibacillus hominis]MBC5636756.1 SgrR family transcriptional regulator [Ornithinibacillus hominis]